MKKTLFFIMIIISCHSLFSQDLLVQSNNTDDNVQLKQEISNDNKVIEILNSFSSINKFDAFSNVTITFQVVFFDPLNIGSLNLKTNHNVSNQYIQQWKNLNHSNRILILFNKEGSTYKFNNIAVSQNIEEGQVPDLVVEYIINYVKLNFTPKTNKETVYEIINAFKNAFDKRFQDDLIQQAKLNINRPDYYRSRASWREPYYYFETEITDLQLVKRFIDPIIYNDVYKTTNPTPQLAFLYDYYNQDDIYDIERNIVSDDDIYIIREGLFNNVHVSYTCDEDYIELITDDDEYNTIEKIKNAKRSNGNPFFNRFPTVYNNIVNETRLLNDFHFDNHSPIYTYYDNDKNCFTKIKLYAGRYTTAGAFTSKQGNCNYSGFRDNSPTWCNRFVYYLTEAIYNHDVIPNNKNANYLNTHINDNSPDKYIELSKTEQELIWKYINKGYPVIFSSYNSSGSGHIEFGFPDGYKTMNIKNFYDQNDATPNIPYDYKTSGTNIKMTVGAGGHLGYKNGTSFHGYSQKFIYLKYLFYNF